MKLLFDECVPRKLRFDLSSHGREVTTVGEAGFSGTENGELLNLAEAKFDALLTRDNKTLVEGEYQSSSSGQNQTGWLISGSTCKL